LTTHSECTLVFSSYHSQDIQYSLYDSILSPCRINTKSKHQSSSSPKLVALGHMRVSKLSLSAFDASFICSICIHLLSNRAAGLRSCAFLVLIVYNAHLRIARRRWRRRRWWWWSCICDWKHAWRLFFLLFRSSTRVRPPRLRVFDRK